MEDKVRNLNLMQENINQLESKHQIDHLKKEREKQVFNYKVATDEAKERMEKDREINYKESQKKELQAYY